MKHHVRNSLAILVAAAVLYAPGTAGAQLKGLDDVLQGRSLVGQAIKGLAVAYAVRQSSKPLDKFINTVTLRNRVPQHLATKVVPILSVGERGYVGGAQVVGPRSLVNKVQVVWQYEEGFNRDEYRIKTLVPSSSLNPLQLKRVPRVGLGALIDVSLGGGFSSDTRSGRIDAGRVLRAGAIAGVVLAAAKPLNQFINTITFNKDSATKVVPQASFGETAYVGGAQVTGSTGTIGKVKAVFEYWDSFDKGRYRVRTLVPVNGVDPTRIRRVEGVGLVALIDTSIAAQKRARQDRERSFGRSEDIFNKVLPIQRDREDDRDDGDRRAGHDVLPRHDNGLHLGWERGKHKGWYKKRGKAEL